MESNGEWSWKRIIATAICYNYNILYIFDDGLVVTTGKYYILYIE